MKRGDVLKRFMPAACVTVDPIQPLEATAVSLTGILHVHEEAGVRSNLVLGIDYR